MDAYEVLGVSSDATEEAIRKAYLQLCLAWHPDRAKAQGRDLEECTQRFQAIQEAYEILTQEAPAPETTAWEEDWHTLFDMLQREEQAEEEWLEALLSMKKKPSSPRYTFRVTLREFLYGGTRKVRMGEHGVYEIEIPIGVAHGHEVPGPVQETRIRFSHRALPPCVQKTHPRLELRHTVTLPDVLGGFDHAIPDTPWKIARLAYEHPHVPIILHGEGPHASDVYVYLKVDYDLSERVTKRLQKARDIFKKITSEESTTSPPAKESTLQSHSAPVPT